MKDVALVVFGALIVMCVVLLTVSSVSQSLPPATELCNRSDGTLFDKENRAMGANIGAGYLFVNDTGIYSGEVFGTFVTSKLAENYTLSNGTLSFYAPEDNITIRRNGSFERVQTYERRKYEVSNACKRGEGE